MLSALTKSRSISLFCFSFFFCYRYNKQVERNKGIISTRVVENANKHMSSQSIPEQLRKSLERHMEESDLHDDEEMAQIMSKLSDLSAKVAAAKAKVLAKRKTG